jgi:hypothetical protein
LSATSRLLKRVAGCFMSAHDYYSFIGAWSELHLAT